MMIFFHCKIIYIVRKIYARVQWDKFRSKQFLIIFSNMMDLCRSPNNLWFKIILVLRHIENNIVQEDKINVKALN